MLKDYEEVINITNKVIINNTNSKPLN